MSDKEIIFRYLNRYYFVSISTEKNHKNVFMLVTIGKGSTHSREEIYEEIKLIFKGVDNVLGYFEDWFTESLTDLSRNFNSFLNDCRIILGPTNWVVKHKLYGEIDPNLLTTYHTSQKAAHNALTYLFNRWYDEKVIEESEKAMRNF